MSDWLCRILPWHQWQWTGRKNLGSREAKCRHCRRLWAVYLVPPMEWATVRSEEYEAAIGWGGSEVTMNDKPIFPGDIIRAINEERSRTCSIIAESGCPKGIKSLIFDRIHGASHEQE